MTKQAKKEEIIAYGEDATALLQYIVDGTKTKADAMVKYSIDFSRLKKLKLSIKKEFGRPYVKCKVRYDVLDIIYGDVICSCHQYVDTHDPQLYDPHV